MQAKTLKTLEFDKIKALLLDYTASSLGAAQVKALTPSSTYEEVTRLQAETDEAAKIIRLKGSAPLSGIYDLAPYVKHAEIGGTLRAKELMEIASTISASRTIKRFIDHLLEEDVIIPIIKEKVSQIPKLTSLEHKIRNAIDENGNILDHASQKLRHIRRKLRGYEGRIREKLESYTREKNAQKMLSESIITIRNERYVIPVKQEYRSHYGGIVHDQSSSGQTLFIEPQSVVDLNNQLRESQLQEKQEIERILIELSENIAEVTEELQLTLNILGDLDFMFAKARYGKAIKGSKPIINDKGIIHLYEARHPLIEREKVVANDIMLGKDFTTMVITGPNTGGKTIALKTLGLCTIMAQAGLQVPTLEGSQVAVFKDIFADIGDEQSIEQSLSTFSSHMVHIVDILEQVDDKSLVLFDELGAGTDPQEGAALAIAILDEVYERGAKVVATTHYPELKAYGYNRESVINASVEFDVETLSPTYKLLIGVPGRSNAFEISDRLGLQKEIIDHAKSYVGVDSKNVENMIAALEKTRKEAEKELEEANRILEESEQLRADLKKEWNNFERKKTELYKKAEEKAEKALQKAREEAQIIVDEVRQMKDKAMWKEHEWIEARKMLDEAQPELVKEEKVEDVRADQRELEVGDEIKHKTLQQTGQVIEKKNKNEYVIQVGVMKITAKRKDLIFVKKAKDEREDSPTRPVSHMITTSGGTVKTELDLRGERYEDALLKLEKYIDDALVQGYPRVTIIHGKGTGALRKGVEKFIQSHPYIKSHRLGGQNEGASGVTVIEFH